MSQSDSVAVIPDNSQADSQLDELSSILSLLTSSLGQAASSSENDFLNLGLRLQMVHAQAVELGSKAMEAAGFIGNKSDDGLLVRAGDLARGSLAELEGYREEISGNLSYLEVVVDRLGKLYNQCGRLERIGKFLRVVALNTGVESAKSKRASRVFSGFAYEIMEFATQVIQVAEIVSRESDAARAYQVSALEEMNRGSREFSALIGDSRGLLLKALDKIEELFNSSFKIMDQAGTRLGEVSDSIGELVVGVQLHDSMSQRIDHCLGALNQAGQLLAAIKAAPHQPEEERNKLGAVHLILNLQTEQLRRVIADIEAAHERNLRAFDEIIREIGLLSKSLAGLDTIESDWGGESDHSGQDPFSVLKSALKRLNDLLVRGRGLMERMTGTTGQASTAADKLAGQTSMVVNISYRVHLMAINAILKASSLGIHGRTLKVLAEEVSHLAGQSGDFVVEVNTIIEPINASVEALKNRAAKGAGLADSARLDEESLEAGLKEVSAAFSEFRDRSQGAFDLAENLGKAISGSRDDLGFLADLAGGYGRDLKLLEKCGEMLSPWADGGGSEAIMDLAGLAGRYTMEQERDAHQSVLGPARQVAPGEVDLFGTEGSHVSPQGEREKVEEQASEDDDLGDNVELF